MSDFSNAMNRPESGNEAQPASFNADEASSAADIDMSVLLDFEEAQCEGEPDFIVELIDLYLEDVPRQLSAMKDCVAKADAVSLKRAAHTLKGSSANLGAGGIAALCQELEQTDSSESFQRSNEIVNRLEETFARVRAVLLAERQGRV